MKYQHTEDIDKTRAFSVKSLNPKVKIVINRTANAIERLSIWNSTDRHILADIFRGLWATHRAIAILLSKKEEYSSISPISIEAMSLAREQVESLFTVCLLLDDPNRWFSVYKKDAWQRQYRKYLLEKHECEKLPRFRKSINEIEPMFDKLQKSYGISSDEKKAIEFKFNNPKKELPPHLKNKLPEPFPTAGRAKDLIKNTSIKDCLERWYQEYRYLSGYSHGHMIKTVGLTILESRDLNLTEEVKQKYFENVLEHGLIVSYVSSASACAEACPILEYNVEDTEVIEVKAALTKLWNKLTDLSLLGKLFWNIRISKILGVIQI